MARYENPTAQRALVALATAGVALGSQARRRPPPRNRSSTWCAPGRPPWGTSTPSRGCRGSCGTVGYVTGPVAGLKPNPLAGTGVDPLDNGVGTQLADFQPLATQALTGPVAQAQSIGSMPVVGQVAGLLSNG